MALHSQKPMHASDAGHGSLTTYAVGFVLSAILTLAAYLSVVNRVVSGQTLVLLVTGLAVTQLLVQLIFFLHLGSEGRPRWNLMLFAFMLLVVGILVLGSLWIMHNLDYHMMPARDEVDRYLHSQEGGM